MVGRFFVPSVPPTPQIALNFSLFIKAKDTPCAFSGSLTRIGRSLKMNILSKATLALFAAGSMSVPAMVAAHNGPEAHNHILSAPIAGKRNNYWFDYKSDIEEAESELVSDLRRAKTAQDEREARAEFRREIADARKDYTKEMRERGYVSRGSVEVLDR
jgi:hypothetical protein